jgi:SAM-dependent methyltransferase
MYRSPRPTQAEIVRSYNSGINYAQWQNELEIRGELWRKRLRLVEKLKPSGKLLDIGTGDGFFLKFAASTFEAHSTEISETGASYARERGFDPLIGDFLDLKVVENSFDVITLWHALEHLPHPGLVLNKVKETLKPGGIVVIAVPNEQYQLIFNCRKQNPLGVMNWGDELHLTHFLPATLKRYLSKSGFRILDFGVDDVHVWRPVSARIGYHANRLINAFSGWHFDRAMYVIAGRVA